MEPTEDHKTMVLKENHLTFVKMYLGYSLKVLIRAGFTTDGASVPSDLTSGEYKTELDKIVSHEYPDVGTRWDMENLIAFLVGTPWDMPRLLAAVVHDALYGMKWMWRWVCDQIYRKILSQNDYNAKRTAIEYECIRLAGWRNWNAVTKEETEKTRALVDVELVRTKRIPDIIRELRAEEESLRHLVRREENMI